MEGTELGFGGKVEDWEAVGGDESVEMSAGESEGEDGVDGGEGVKDLEEEFGC